VGVSCGIIGLGFDGLSCVWEKVLIFLVGLIVPFSFYGL